MTVYVVVAVGDAPKIAEVPLRAKESPLEIGRDTMGQRFEDGLTVFDLDRAINEALREEDAQDQNRTA